MKFLFDCYAAWKFMKYIEHTREQEQDMSPEEIQQANNKLGMGAAYFGASSVENVASIKHRWLFALLAGLAD